MCQTVQDSKYSNINATNIRLKLLLLGMLGYYTEFCFGYATLGSMADMLFPINNILMLFLFFILLKMFLIGYPIMHQAIKYAYQDCYV